MVKRHHIGPDLLLLLDQEILNDREAGRQDVLQGKLEHRAQIPVLVALLTWTFHTGVVDDVLLGTWRTATMAAFLTHDRLGKQVVETHLTLQLLVVLRGTTRGVPTRRAIDLHRVRQRGRLTCRATHFSQDLGKGKIWT